MNSTALENRILVQVTEVGKCPRARQYRMCGLYGLEPYRKVVPLGRHYYSIRGDLAHIAMSVVFGGREALPTSKEIASAYDVDAHMAGSLVDFTIDFADKFNSWYNSTSINLEPTNIIASEKPLFMPAGQTHRLMGVPDLLLRKQPRILDFKLGRRSFSREYKWQLGAYRELAIVNEVYELSEEVLCTNIFFGGKRPEEITYEQAMVAESMDCFSGGLEALMQSDYAILDSAQVAPIRFSIECAFCEYRHHCRGV